MRRNVHANAETGRSSHGKLTTNEVNMNLVIGMLKEIKDDMKQYLFHMRMDCVDVSVFFPLKDDESLRNFMDRDHAEWHLRQKGFYHLLFTTVTKSKKKFSTALLHTLFTRNFIKTHKWPG